MEIISNNEYLKTMNESLYFSNMFTKDLDIHECINTMQSMI